MIKHIYFVLALGALIMGGAANEAILVLVSAFFGMFFLQELSMDNRISKLDDSIDKLREELKIKKKKKKGKYYG